MSIEGIFIAPSASMPMQSVAEGTLIPGKGIEGDRYCNFTGTYSVLRISKRKPGHREPGRQLTLLSAESVEAALDRAGLSRPSSLGDIRRNIVIRGISSGKLLAAAGRVVRIGQACRVLIHRHTVPCMYNERKNRIPGMTEAIWNDSGVSCEVLRGGAFRVGDSVEITEEKREIDDGNQPPGYYISPSQRTAHMVKSALEINREKKMEYLKVDPVGVERVDASYGTVGLKFWPNEK
uniref:MOSC domain-containing protein n=1 Tax=Corethron hystrix TaxID=216773 RepID=A0A7S1B9Z2_9STRA|mmetsp:Transcript_18880/g.43036  ORF Transcript_18880/g.43036 Transcript_18880/m.43036 type:complete len:236 (+) Transcript_18880:55-762(+)